MSKSPLYTTHGICVDLKTNKLVRTETKVYVDEKTNFHFYGKPKILNFEKEIK
jgi:hypothetical protein